MSDQISFKCRVRGVAINCANQYYEYYVKNSYLLFFQAFIKKPYYVIEAEATNYLHLVGVSTSLSAACFFDKCLDGTLSEEDFGLSFHGEDPKHSKGSIRQKILTLPSMFSCLTENALVDEPLYSRILVGSLKQHTEYHDTLRSMISGPLRDQLSDACSASLPSDPLL